MTNQNFQKSEPYIRCPVCQNHYSFDNFYKYETKIDNKIYQSEYILDACKFCLPLEEVKWQLSHYPTPSEAYTPISDTRNYEAKPYINKNYLRNKILELEKQRLKDINSEDLLSAKEVFVIFGVKDKHWIRDKVNMGVLPLIKIRTTLPTDTASEVQFKRYFLKKDVDKLYKMWTEGKFLKRSNAHPAPILPLPEYAFKGVFDYYIYIENNSVCKPCVKCFTQIPREEFPPVNQLKDGRGHVCKPCCNEFQNERYNNLSEEEKKKYIMVNMIWRKKNPEKVKQQRVNYIKNNPIVKVIQSIRRRSSKIINDLIKYTPYHISGEEGQWFKKELRETGCSRKFLKEHIESKWQEGMNWDNYGPGYQTDGKGLPLKDKNGQIIILKQWQIDHVFPLSKINMRDKKKLRMANHYTNLQPLWSGDNSKKGNKIPDEFNQEFLEENIEMVSEEKVEECVEF